MALSFSNLSLSCSFTSALAYISLSESETFDFVPKCNNHGWEQSLKPAVILFAEEDVLPTAHAYHIQYVCALQQGGKATIFL